jgi:hypothetical protein
MGKIVNVSFDGFIVGLNARWFRLAYWFRVLGDGCVPFL